MSTKMTSLLAGLLLALPLAAAADPPARNPDYAHALPDLRTARWLLAQQPGDPPTRTSEDQAIQHIDNAIRAITQSAFNDHQDASAHEQVEMGKDHSARLHQAMDLLHRAHAEISKEVADSVGVSVRNQALDDIDKAGREIGHALEGH
jgi:hypothetical protein